MNDKLNSEMIHHLDHDGKRIILVGTAHVSKESVDLVEAVIADVKPDTVCVELCESRAQAIRQKDRWQEMDIIKVIKEKKAFLPAIQPDACIISEAHCQPARGVSRPGDDTGHELGGPSVLSSTWQTGISVPPCRGPGATWGCGVRSS
jgi:hypothetical protein